MSIFGGIITQGLIAYFDVNNPQSLKYTSSELYLQSLVKWKASTTDNIDLPDYGLTAYDIGRSTHLTGSTQLFKTDNRLQLFPIKALNSTGTTLEPNTFILSTAQTSTRIYLRAQGGYLSNFFKLEDYNWELLPYRYNMGLTLETWINIDHTTSALTQDNSGLFLYMGTRAENKFSTLYSGDSGYTTSNGLPLGPDSIDLEEGIYDNVIAFGLNSNLQLGYKYINSTGLTVENYSEGRLGSGWKHITLTFKPCTTFPDDENGGQCGLDAQSSRYKTVWSDVVDCLDRREGQLTMYVNGRPFFKEECFPEQFWFQGLNTEREKSLGVPYNLNWGGGSFGLKHSYHYAPKVLYQSALTESIEFVEISSSTSGFTTTSSYTQVAYSGLTYFEQDHTKDNLLIESNFQGGFFGGLSTLRVYNFPLNSEDVKLNYNLEAQSYGLRPFKGGRVIYTQ